MVHISLEKGLVRMQIYEREVSFEMIFDYKNNSDESNGVGKN